MSNDRMVRLYEEAIDQRYTRRQIFKRAAVLGLSASVAALIAAACGGGAPDDGGNASGGGGETPTESSGGNGSSGTPSGDTGGGSNDNPLGVDPEAPLDVVIFKGGYGDEYAKNAEAIYQEMYPDAEVSHQGIQRLGEQLRPRFVGGNPPDVIDNSGAGNLDTAALVSEGQLADLADLMKAPSLDTEGKAFKDTLIPGSQTNGVYDGTQYVLLYAYSVYGIWYSQPLLEEKGWEYPQTWDEMLTLCEEIKNEGIAPWAYQGKYPQYMLFILNQLAYKEGGIEAIAKLDNLEPEAWKQPEVRAAAEALYALADKGYLMEGTEALTHTESQAEWLKGKAVFIPCGSWLENEMKDLIPDGFDMVVKPAPLLSDNAKLPFEAIQASAGENFIVPSQGKNVQGGKEFLRILFSKKGARFFSENTKSLTVVLNSADDLDLGSAFQSVRDAASAAGENTFVALYGTWYRKLYDEASNKMGALLTKQIDVDTFLNDVQTMADQIAQDDSIEKYEREV